MAISGYEQNYMTAVLEIMQHGSFQKNERTGIATKRIPHLEFRVDCDKECPILKSKKVETKSAIDEMLWIFQKGSNDIHDLNSHIWDSWANKDGIVEKTYGYQVKKTEQVHRLINELSADSSSRRGVLCLWDNEDLPDMGLVPCVYTSVWDVIDGKLHTMVVSRSCDLLVGGVFNIFQYYIFNRMIARHLGLTPGSMTFIAADAHIYENQMEECKKQWNWYSLLLTVGQLLNEYGDNLTEEEVRDKIRLTANAVKASKETIQNSADLRYYQIYELVFDTMTELDNQYPGLKLIDIYKSNPTCEFSETMSNDFWEMKVEDVILKDYQCMPKIKYNVAV